LVATHLTYKALKDWSGKICVVTVDTTVMIPPAIPFVEKVAKEYGWELHILKPKKSFWEQVERRGMPSMNRRWCCYLLKLEPIIEFMRIQKPPRTTVTGLRRQESSRRKNFSQWIFQHRSWSYNYSPIIDWSDEQVLRYIRQHNLLEPPWYRLGVKETCMCGVFSCPREMMCVRANWPEFFQQFIEIEKRFRKGGTAFYFQNRPYSAKEFLKQKTLEEVG